MILLLLLLCAWPGAAAAQQAQPAPPVVDPSEAQVLLYAKAFEAFHAEDYPKAIELLRSALALGELNLLYLNLGRAYFRNGQCVEAEDAYAKALKAPQSSSVPAEQIKAKLSTFRTDLDKGCPGTLKMVCQPEGIMVSVDEQPAQVCQDLKLAAGFHKLEASLGEASQMQVVKVEPRETSTVNFTMGMAEVMGQDGGPSPWPWVVAGTGAAVLGAGLVMDLVLLGPANDDLRQGVLDGEGNLDALRSDAQTLRSAVLGTYLTGALLTVAGGVWLWLDGGGQEQAEPAGAGLELWLDPQRAGVQWRGRW